MEGNFIVWDSRHVATVDRLISLLATAQAKGLENTQTAPEGVIKIEELDKRILLCLEMSGGGVRTAKEAEAWARPLAFFYE